MVSNESKPPLPKRINVFVVIILSLLTGGIYTAVWSMRRTAELNRALPQRRMSVAPSYVLLALSIVTLPEFFIEFQPPYDTWFRLANIAWSLTMFWIALGMKRQIALLGKPSTILWTFLLTFMYIQHQINGLHREGDSREPLEQQPA